MATGKEIGKIISKKIMIRHFNPLFLQDLNPIIPPANKKKGK
jgi:hypothetical protein